ncbi:MAG: glycosyltransferase family 4 protein [Deltaproteobacteria bacterium]|nr:glycosyltransferase family 4 protein [Deltaproteobacteria bacterium]
MKILLVNHRYFVSGGPERYMFSLIELMHSKGHQIIPFSINYSNNRQTEYSQYFISPPISEEHVYFSDLRLNLYEKLILFGKTIYNFEAKKKIKEVIRKEGIDIVYTLQTVNFLYPSIIDGCKEMGIPVVARLSDFQLVCPTYTFFRDGEICERCKNGYYWAVKNKCAKNSYVVSFARVFAMYVHKILRIQEKIDGFIAPSEFLRDKMIECGMDRSKIVWIPTYIDLNDYMPTYSFDDHILYVGNILQYKGLEYLIKAFETIKNDVRLKNVGSSSDGEDERLKNYIRVKGIKNIDFLGFKHKEELKEIYQKAMFIVMPSIWYENMPRVILESMAYGKPIIASNIGSIPELIDHGKNGFLFEPKNIDDLKEKIQHLLNNPGKIIEMGKRARQKAEERYGSELHYEKLIGVFHKVLGKRNQ